MSNTSLTFISDEALQRYLNENAYENAEHSYLTFRANMEQNKDFEALSHVEQEKVLSFAERAIEKHFAQFGRDTATLSDVESFSTPQETFDRAILPMLGNHANDFDEDTLYELISSSAHYLLDNDGKVLPRAGRFYFVDPTVDISSVLEKAETVTQLNNLENMAREAYPQALEFMQKMEEFRGLNGKDALNVMVNFEKGHLDGDLYRCEGATPEEKFGRYLIDGDLAPWFMKDANLDDISPVQVGKFVAEKYGYVLEDAGYYKADYETSLKHYDMAALEEIISADYEKHLELEEESLLAHLNELDSVSEEINNDTHSQHDNEQVR